MPQFRLDERLKTILKPKINMRNWQTFRMFLFVLEWYLGVNESETAAFSLCFA
jgi:hypothetical protein